MSYQVNEVFNTIQGEGINAGQPATFIRLQGCTVGCVWCDTKYTWAKGGQRYEVPALVGHLDLKPLAVITGGEPTLYNLDELFIGLQTLGHSMHGYDFKIQLETSGQNELKGEIVPDWITWSPKKELKYSAPISLQRNVAEVKWVVDDELDLATIERAMDHVSACQPMNRVYCVLMPEGCPPSEEHIKKALNYLTIHPTWRFSDRIQWRIGVK